MIGKLLPLQRESTARKRSVRDPERRAKSRFGRVALVAAVACVVFVVSGIAYVLTLPDVRDAQTRVAVIVRSHHGVIAGPPPPTKLKKAVVATEDKYFYSNVFVNVLYGAARAAFASFQRNGDPGGSTIEQQLAKQLYPHGGGLAGILEEIGLGIKLSLRYSKAQILSMYLNVVNYGNGYWGDVAAANGYFGVAPERLSWAQATLLAGLPQAPSLYDPIRHFRLAKQRQGQVIDQLVDNHYLSKVQGSAIYRNRLLLGRGSRKVVSIQADGKRLGSAS